MAIKFANLSLSNLNYAVYEICKFSYGVVFYAAPCICAIDTDESEAASVAVDIKGSTEKRIERTTVVCLFVNQLGSSS